MNFIDKAFESNLSGDDFLQAMADVYSEDNVRDELDKLQIKQIVKENEIKPSYKEITYYPIHDVNLYRDGKLLSYGIPMIIYDVDGTVISEY